MHYTQGEDAGNCYAEGKNKNFYLTSFKNKKDFRPI